MKGILKISALLLAVATSSAFAQAPYAGTSADHADVRTADSALWGVGG